MAGPITVMLGDVLALVRARKVPMAPELAGYLVLEVAESSANANAVVDPAQVHLGDEGTITIRGAAQPGDGEGALRELLAALLEASGSQTPALAAVARKPSQAAPLSILMQELESALIPVNRAAGRRALARLAREARRMQQSRGGGPLPAAAPKAPRPELPRPAARPPTPPRPPEKAAPSSSNLPVAPPKSGSIPATGSVLFGSQNLSEPPKAEVPFEIQKDDIDQLLRTFEVSDARPAVEVARELKSMAGLEPTPPPPNFAPVPAEPEDEDEPETLLSQRSLLVAAKNDSARNVSVETLPSASFPPETLNSDVPTKIEAAPPFREEKRAPKPTKRTHVQTIKLDRIPAKKNRSFTITAIITLATLLVGLLSIYFLKPNLFSALRRTELPAAVPTAAPTSPVKQCRASVVIRKAPPEAEILLRVGQAPTDVPRLPVGTRIELVATAEGYAPARGVVLPTSAWSRSTNVPEFALKIDLTAAKPGKIPAWPAAEAGTQVGGRGEPGTVRVTTNNVDGAEIWLLAGLGPEASYEPLPCDRPFEFLIAGSLSYRKRLRIAPEDIAKAPEGATPGQKRIELTAP
jgi:hypothetical protein